MTRDRGQTTQDYILGVSIMLATVLFVFGFLPGVFDSYESSVDGIDRAQTERAAEHLIENYTVDGKRTVLDNGSFYAKLDGNFSGFRAEAGLDTETDRQAKPNINVKLVNATEFTGNGTRDPVAFPGRSAYEFGDDYDNQSSATRVRVVGLEDDPTDECTPACYLIVRVW
jgi:hypothetical protein